MKKFASIFLWAAAGLLLCAAVGLGLYFLPAKLMQPKVLDATFFGEIGRVTLQVDVDLYVVGCAQQCFG